MRLTIRDVCAESKRVNDEHGFDSKVPDDKPEVFSEKMLLVVSEISEALEEWRNHASLRGVYYNQSAPTKPEGIPIEIADAIIRLLGFCESNGIDIEAALKMKMAYNETRPFRHGNKRA